jgi:ATP-GRASP peptide maturase of grasp-with-spasm system
MILVISSVDDKSTVQVLDWIRYFKVEFLRISAFDEIIVNEINPLKGEDFQFTIQSKKYCLKDFTSVWYRRSSFKIFSPYYTGVSDFEMSKSINIQLRHESIILSELINRELQKKSLNSEFNNSLNKLEVISLCERYGIKTPETIITSKKENLVNFKNRYTTIITKNFTPGVFVKTESVSMYSTTMLVTDEMIDGLAENFYPMLFQELIEKSFEIRSFYLNGKFYSSAIFSQNDEKTKLDFRNYNFEKPNRTPPFKIPDEIENKLINLMNAINLNSGSIDLIVTPEGNFIFLEVNPIGQFYQVSHPCNYNIEKQIALFLKKLK